ncbi:MAG TPA: hypothetical protein VGI08_10165 [Diaminobutyricibacter sp.]
MAFEPALRAGSATPERDASGFRRVLASPLVLWIAFLLVHLLLGFLAFHSDGEPLGDVYLVYKPWAQLAQVGSVVGIQSDWVYPIGAIVPIMLPLLLGADNYIGSWLTLVLLLDAGAFAVLTIGRRPRQLVAAWWWLGFLLLLGPIAIGRLDSVSVPLVIVGLLWLTLRERVAVVMLTAATWIKVWPAAILAAVVVSVRTRWQVLVVAGVTSLILVILALTFGAGWHVLSFITMQTGRGLQIEAPVSAPWMWEAALARPHAFVYYDPELRTFEVTGDGSSVASSLMNPLLGIAVVVVLLIGIRAVRSGAPMTRLLPSLSLALVATFIVFNKVGSPQYITWLAAPVVVGLVYRGRGFRTPAILVLVTALLTQVMYPNLYMLVLNVHPAGLAVLTARNIMLLVVLGWAVWSVWRAAHPSMDNVDEIPVRVWPFRALAVEGEDAGAGGAGGPGRRDTGIPASSHPVAGTPGSLETKE